MTNATITQVMLSLEISHSGQAVQVTFFSASIQWKNILGKRTYRSPALETLRIENTQFSSRMRMPDEILGTWNGTSIDITNKALLYAGADALANIKRPISVIIAAESPHKDEYEKERNQTSKVYEPVRPLNGRVTRNNIDARLPAVLRQMKIPAETAVILANPVQWQASLYTQYSIRKSALIKPVRDEVWKALFYAFCRQDFLDRIAKYNAGWILNAGTDNLRGYVTDAIFSQFSARLPTWETEHPFQWLEVPLVRRAF